MTTYRDAYFLLRRYLEHRIECDIGFLNAFDGDCDIEDDDPAEDADTAEDGGDAEPSMGWTVNGFMGQTFDPDREFDPADRGEPEGGE